MARKLGMGFLGAKFWSMEFFGFCLKPKGFCWVLIFAPFDHPCHLKPEERPPPPHPGYPPTPAQSLRYRWPFSSLLALHSGSASCDDTKNGLLRRHCPCTTKAQKGLRKSEVGSGKWEVGSRKTLLGFRSVQPPPPLRKSRIFPEGWAGWLYTC